MKTKFESIQKVRNDGFPKVTEIKAVEKFKSNAKDPDFDFPIANLEKEYQ